MALLEAALQYLQTLKDRGFPLSLDGENFVLYPEPPTGSGSLHASLESIYETRRNFLVLSDLRGFVEREIETRGLWWEYRNALIEVMGYTESRANPTAAIMVSWSYYRRATLLEVLAAAVEVTKNMKAS